MLQTLAQMWMSVRTYVESNTWVATTLDIGKVALALIVIVALTVIALRIRKAIISRAFSLIHLTNKHQTTLESLALSVSRYVLLTIALLCMLAAFGVQIGPLLAGAGIVGLVFGFGAQTLIRDVISGLFILFENQYTVGDTVTINANQVTGVVEQLNLRSTHIRTWAQQLVVIQNSEVRMSQNFSRQRMRAIVTCTVPYTVPYDTVVTAVHQVKEQLLTTMPHVFLTDADGAYVELPQLYGITDIETHPTNCKYTVVALVKDTHYNEACNALRLSLATHLLMRHDAQEL
jgi:small conductance mechanosensitive channel